MLTGGPGQRNVRGVSAGRGGRSGAVWPRAIPVGSLRGDRDARADAGADRFALTERWKELSVGAES